MNGISQECGASVRRERIWFALSLTVVLVSGAVSVFRFPLNHDAAWLLHLAGKINNGAELYVDFPEVNPPLIVWLNMPIAYMAEMAGLPVAAVFHAAVLVLGCASVFWSASIVGSRMGPVVGRSWLAAASYAALALPGYDFGQREHLALLLVLPYLGEAALRCCGAGHKRGLEIAACAAIGVALKPHFLLLPLFVEGLVIRRTRHGPSAGAWLICGLLVLYAASVAVLTPEYFETVRMFASSYWNYSSQSWYDFLFVPECYGAILLLAIAWCTRPNLGNVIAVLLVAAVAFAVAALVQRKAWSYHWYPVLAVAWLVFAQAAATSITYRDQWPPQLLVCLAAALLATVACISASGRAARLNPFPAVLKPVIEELGGGPVMILATPLRAAFPLVTEPGIGTSSRFPAMGVMRAASMNHDQELAEYVRNAVREDLQRIPPRLLIVETASFDYLAQLSRDPQVAKALAEYELVKTVGPFRFFKRPKS